MTFKFNWNLALHVLAQILAQSAVMAIVPSGYEKFYAAAVAIIGVFVAFADQSVSNSTQG